VADLGEHALLARVLARLPRPGARVLVGPGDDAAVVEPGRNLRLVMTTDALVEHVHFSRAWSAPADIGHKALAVSLSDLAAMGAAPQWALLSMALPQSCLVAEVEGIVDGLATLARAHGVSVVGGNLTTSPSGVAIDVTAVGEVAPRRWLTRAGGRPGDELWVSGTVGLGAVGLAVLREGSGSHPSTPLETAPEVAECVARYRRPDPRVRLGLAMGRGRAARAAMDSSDGLADAVMQLAGASGCGALVEAAALPIDPAARGWWTARGEDAVTKALVGGDDYELLFAVPPRWGGRLRAVRARVTSPALTKIGVLTKGDRIELDRDRHREPMPRGYEHFGRSR
jgi:thiamine-monophosphate kinase